MADDIRRWLRALGLDAHAGAFIENGVDFALLPEITNDDLKDLGVSRLADRKRLLAAIRDLGGRREVEIDQAPSANAERRQVTVMFCDLVGSTALSQELDPEILHEVLGRYHDAVSEAVRAYQGHVAKFLGDGVLTYFGWPQAFEDQAERAVRASLDAIDAITGMALAGGLRLEARIGIASGAVVIGDLVGKSSTETNAVSGETPNLAARLQAIAAPGQVVVSEATQRLIGQSFDLRALGAHELKGFAAPVSVWAVAREIAAPSRFDSLHVGSDSYFIGRESELNLLLGRWQLAEGGEGQAVVVYGEAGIGKSRLLKALRDNILGRPIFRLRYQCSPYHSGRAFYPIIRQLEYAADFEKDDSAAERLSKLRDLLQIATPNAGYSLALFANLLSIEHDDSQTEAETTPQQQRERTYEALIEQIQALSRKMPVLIEFEDAHWADPTTQELLAQSVPLIAPYPIYMIISARPEWQPRWLGRFGNLSTLSLNHLGKGHTAELVRALAGAQTTDDLVEQVVSRTDGVPLFVEELTRSILESSASARVWLDVPETLQASLLSRLDRLGPAKRVAQLGAVIGRNFSRFLLSSLSDYAEGDLAGALTRLVDSELITVRGAGPAALYTFKHALVQEAAYSTLLRRERQALHGRLVDALESSFTELAGSEPELLAHHCLHAGRDAAAVANWHRAGQRAISQAAYSEAVNYLHAALAQLEHMPENQSNGRLAIDIRLELRPALGAVGGYPAVLENIEATEPLTESLGLADTSLAFGCDKVHVLHQLGRLQDAIDNGERVLTLSRQAEDKRSLLAATFNLAHAHFFRGQAEQALETIGDLPEVVEQRYRHERIGTTGTSACIWLGNTAAAHALLGNHDAALRLALKARVIAEETGHPFDRAMSRHWLGFILLRQDEIEAAARVLDACAEDVERYRLGFVHAWAGIHLGASLLTRGDATAAVKHLESVASDANAQGLLTAETWARSNLAAARLGTGEVGSAEQLAHDMQKHCESTGYRWFELLNWQHLGRCQSELGDLEAAESCFRTSLEISTELNTTPDAVSAHQALAQVWSAQKREETARAASTTAQELARELSFPPPQLLESVD